MTAPLLSAIALTLAASSAVPVDTPFVPVGEKVAGLDASDWSRAWWQWVVSFPAADDPRSDATGARCGARQQGSVWFLADADAAGSTTRSCAVPAGKYLFFPLVSFMVVPTPDQDLPCEMARSMADLLTDGATHLVLRIDGQPQVALEARRIASQGCFDVGAHRQPRTTLLYPSAANGYYALLKPLAPGRHELQFGGALPDQNKFVTYTLDVR